MFVVEAMLRYVTFRLSSRDVSFPPRTINAAQRNGEGLYVRTYSELRMRKNVPSKELQGTAADNVHKVYKVKVAIMRHRSIDLTVMTQL